MNPLNISLAPTACHWSLCVCSSYRFLPAASRTGTSSTDGERGSETAVSLQHPLPPMPAPAPARHPHPRHQAPCQSRPHCLLSSFPGFALSGITLEMTPQRRHQTRTTGTKQTASRGRRPLPWSPASHRGASGSPLSLDQYIRLLVPQRNTRTVLWGAPPLCGCLRHPGSSPQAPVSWHPTGS